MTIRSRGATVPWSPGAMTSLGSARCRHCRQDSRTSRSPAASSTIARRATGPSSPVEMGRASDVPALPAGLFYVESPRVLSPVARRSDGSVIAWATTGTPVRSCFRRASFTSISAGGYAPSRAEATVPSSPSTQGPGEGDLPDPPPGLEYARSLPVPGPTSSSRCGATARHRMGRQRIRECDIPPLPPDSVTSRSAPARSAGGRSDGSIVAWGNFPTPARRPATSAGHLLRSPHGACTARASE